MSDAVNRLSAALADRYRIERELGAGGMATHPRVQRAAYGVQRTCPASDTPLHPAPSTLLERRSPCTLLERPS
jgi:hypothetical protein